jgi:hypothetical protein
MLGFFYCQGAFIRLPKTLFIEKPKPVIRIRKKKDSARAKETLLYFIALEGNINID